MVCELTNDIVSNSLIATPETQAALTTFILRARNDITVEMVHAVLRSSVADASKIHNRLKDGRAFRKLLNMPCSYMLTGRKKKGGPRQCTYMVRIDPAAPPDVNNMPLCGRHKKIRIK